MKLASAAAAGATSAVVSRAALRRKRRRGLPTALRVFDAQRRYEVYPEERVVGEKDACGVGMMANMQKPPSHELLQAIMRACQCMEHRGACSSGMDSNIQMCGGDDSGDGAGILTQIPWEMLAVDIALPEDRSGVAVGMSFLTKDTEARARLKERFELKLEHEGFHILGYRQVPVDKSVLGQASARSEPSIEQIVAQHPDARGDELDLELHLARRSIEISEDINEFYVGSPSRRTTIYKGTLEYEGGLYTLNPQARKNDEPILQQQHLVPHRSTSNSGTTDMVTPAEKRAKIV